MARALGSLRPCSKGTGGRRPGPSLTRLVRDALRRPTAPGSSTTNAEVLASRIIRLARAGDGAVLARLRQRLGVDLATTTLTDAEVAALLAARLGLDGPQDDAG